MIKLIEARNYRSLKYVSQRLENFQVLIGANASGKTTFLDVIKFLGDTVSTGIDSAISVRVSNFFELKSNFKELTFNGNGEDIELAVEIDIPNEIINLYNKKYDTIRYEIRIGIMPNSKELSIKDERVVLFIDEKYNNDNSKEKSKFPEYQYGIAILLKNISTSNYIIALKENGVNYSFISEPTEHQKFEKEKQLMNLGIKESVLSKISDNINHFPSIIYLKSILQTGINSFELDNWYLRNPSSSSNTKKILPDGSNLPWLIENLKKDKKKFIQWIEHLQTALPDLDTISTELTEKDNKRYIKIKYKNGIEVSSMLLSEGTLRVLAFTIPAYMKNLTGCFLIEEPENGIHPNAIESIFLSLSSVYNAQILLATHSPIILSIVKSRELLCFAKTQDGVTDIVQGQNHPKLKDWKGNPNLSLLFAGGILS